MEVGGGGGGGVGVLLELGFECGGAVLCGGFGGGALGGLLVELFLEAVDLGADPGRVVSGGRARPFEFTLEPVGTLAVFRRFGGGDVEERLEVGGGGGGGVGVLLELRFECGGALGSPGRPRRAPRRVQSGVASARSRCWLASAVAMSTRAWRSAAALVACSVCSSRRCCRASSSPCAVYSGCVCAGGLLAGLIEIGVGLIERRLELLGAAAVLGGFGG